MKAEFNRTMFFVALILGVSLLSATPAAPTTVQVVIELPEVIIMSDCTCHEDEEY